MQSSIVVAEVVRTSSNTLRGKLAPVGMSVSVGVSVCVYVMA